MDNAQRKIVAAMVVTGLFALVGEYANPQKNTHANPQKNTHPDPFRVILGGSIATALLVGMAELGEPAEKLAAGLATIAVLSATLVYGGPVWKAIAAAVQSKGQGGTPTTPTTPTRPVPAGQAVTVIAPTALQAVAG